MYNLQAIQRDTKITVTASLNKVQMIKLCRLQTEAFYRTSQLNDALQFKDKCTICTRH